MRFGVLGGRKIILCDLDENLIAFFYIFFWFRLIMLADQHNINSSSSSSISQVEQKLILNILQHLLNLNLMYPISPQVQILQPHSY